MPLPLAVPVVAGVLIVGGGTALALRKKKKIPSAVANAAQGGVVFTPAQQAALLQPLSPATKEVLKTRGPDPSQAVIDDLKREQAAGTLDLANILKGTDGALFVKQSPQLGGQPLPDDQLAGIIATDRITVDVGRAGMNIPAIPSGNMLWKATRDVNMTLRTIDAVPIDPRVPDGGPETKIPILAITGIQPDGT